MDKIEKLKQEVGPLSKQEQDMAAELKLEGYSDLIQLNAIKAKRSVAAEIVNAVFGDRFNHDFHTAANAANQ